MKRLSNSANENGSGGFGRNRFFGGKNPAFWGLTLFGMWEKGFGVLFEKTNFAF